MIGETSYYDATCTMYASGSEKNNMQANWESISWKYRPMKRQNWAAPASAEDIWISWYQPKWQRNGFMLNNMRVDLRDTVALYSMSLA